MGREFHEGKTVLNHSLPHLTAAQSGLSLRQDPKKKNTTVALWIGSGIFFLVPLLVPTCSIHQ